GLARGVRAHDAAVTAADRLVPSRTGDAAAGASRARGGAMSCAVGILLLASACSRANEPQLEVVHRILDVAPQPAAGDAVGWCELESEVRPAIGCLPKFPGSIAKLEVADSPLRRRLAVPEAARGGPILVESRLVFAGGGRPPFLPAFVGREPAGETIDVELP